uniref:Secreted protein n=1 Tax=Nelumbo nucifera TaxID=4432 RepID=A0A822YWS7_NELNU|nr:TPA_asm: hypothetical protein HUJ06_005846 [Nelumbo nucifera]
MLQKVAITICILLFSLLLVPSEIAARELAEAPTVTKTEHSSFVGHASLHSKEERHKHRHADHSHGTTQAAPPVPVVIYGPGDPVGRR